MSLQVLLPRDCLLKSFSICFDNEILPVEVQTKDGLVKERNASSLIRGELAGYFFKYLRDAQKMFKDKNFKVDGTPFDANMQSWKLINKLIDTTIINSDFYIDHNIMMDSVEAEKVVAARVGNWVMESVKYKWRSEASEVLKVYNRFMSLAVYLEDLRDTFNSAMNSSVKSWKKEGSMGDIRTPNPFSQHKPIKCFQVGSVVLVVIKGRSDREISFVMTNVHYSRVIDYLKSVAIFSLFTPDINGLGTDLGTLLKLLRYQAKVALSTPNGVGSVFKCARQILFLRGDKSKALGNTPEVLFSSGLDGVKLRYGERAADFLQDITADRKSALNLANIFRIIPHPDADMEEVFDSIEGFRDANKVDERMMPRFEGMVRRAIYESLTQQRIVVRSLPKETDDELAKDFSSKINQTSTPTSSILSAGFTKWASIKFVKVRGIFDKDKQDIPVSNKSSAPNARMSIEDINSIGNFKTVRQYREIKQKLKAVNDIVSTINCKDELGFRAGRIRFREVIKAHEEFERNYLLRGVTIDDIPSDDLSEFVKKNPDNAYTVLTEPKLGEVHKEVTRLFYMAEQALKIMTQVCERFTKKVISKSSGVSIVKTYRARRKEIEAMLYAYTGFIVGIDELSGAQVLYISFDMSEFSKKFPQKIVRKIGEVLGELSGEDWMSRIDLFFRAAVVYHNTRGFVGVKTGVTGGFEGFLNFLWTLAMKVVMDIATQATGVEGVLAVYSDDGLLRLYVDGDRQTITNKVNTIRKVFFNYGLVFHLDKTVVSADIFEYLGMYAEDGNLIPTWIKEVMSIGKRKQDNGLETVGDKIELWDSQCAAVVKANGPHYAAMLTKTLLSMHTLRRLNRRVASRHLAALTIIPFSAGGFRLSSISEVGITSSVEAISEFTADIELMYDYYPQISNAIAKRVLDNLKPEKEAERTIMTGSLLQTHLPDTSGLGVARRLIEGSSMSMNFIKDPVTDEVRYEILAQLRMSDNINTRTLRNLVAEVPDVIEYNKGVAIVKSSAALKFVTREDIKKAQSSDTRRCKSSINDWCDYFSTYDYRSQRVNSSGLTRMYIDQMYPSYSIAHIRESPRVALSVSSVNADIATTFEITKTAKLLYQTYIEPTAKFLGAQLTPEIVAETTFNTAQRRNDRFISTAARLVATNISLLRVYYIIANAFKLPCPALPSTTVISAHRSARNFGMNAVSIHLPVPYHALISSRMTNKMWGNIPRDGRHDRTTYIESAKVATYLNLSINHRSNTTIGEGVTPVLYNLRNMLVNTSNPVFTSAAVADYNLIDDKATEAFTTTIIEENSQANLIDSSVITAGILETVADTPTVRAILLARMEKWLYSCVNGKLNASNAPVVIPDIWKRDIFIEAVIAVSFKLSPPNIRRAVQLSFSRFIEQTDGLSVDDSLRNINALTNLNADIMNRQGAFDNLSDKISTVGSSLALIDMDTRLQQELMDIHINDNRTLKHLIAFLKRRSCTGGETIPTVILNTNTFADTKMSREVKNSVKEAIDSLLCRYIDRATRVADNDERTDTMINYLNIMKYMIRPSGHRNTPFNKHMFAIQMIKFEIFLRQKVDRGEYNTNTSEMKNFRLPGRIVRRICSLNAVIGGRSTNTTGEEMRECLVNEGVPAALFSRAYYVVNKVRNNYRGNSITNDNIMGDDLFVHKLINWILDTYRIVVQGAIENMDIRHNREATLASELTMSTPVEEATMTAADIDDGPLVMMEISIREIINSKTHADLIANLLIAHYSRWTTSGYNSEPYINDITKNFGIFGGSELDIRTGNGNPLIEEITEADFSLSASTYHDKETLTHNYLYVNRLPGGMALMGEEEDRYILIAIIPRGVPIVNTETVSVPVYHDGPNSSPPVYILPKVRANMLELSRVLNTRPRLAIETGEFGSIVLQSAYQRIVGANTTIEDDDHFLVAIAEVVRGAWSMDIGKRVLAMMTAWVSNRGEVTPRMFAAMSNAVYGLSISRNPVEAISTQNSASAVWEWFRMMDIRAGPNIDTLKVQRIVSLVSRNAVLGGGPTAIYNMAPISVNELKFLRGEIDSWEFIGNAAAHIFQVPIQNVAEIGWFDFDEDIPDEW